MHVSIMYIAVIKTMTCCDWMYNCGMIISKTPRLVSLYWQEVNKNNPNYSVTPVYSICVPKIGHARAEVYQTWLGLRQWENQRDVKHPSLWLCLLVCLLVALFLFRKLKKTIAAASAGDLEHSLVPRSRHHIISPSQPSLANLAVWICDQNDNHDRWRRVWQPSTKVQAGFPGRAER